LLSVIVRGLGRGDALLPLAAPVAVAEAAEEFGVECAIKWPNDVWIGDRKLAGILLEGRPQERWAVIGIGLNVSACPPDLPATSLLEASGRDPGVSAVLAAVLAHLEKRLGDKGEGVLAAWRSRDVLAGREVEWNGGSGKAAGIDDEGALLVETEGGRVALDAGEVHLTSIT
jgi:BirA family biotin operon repressor/biotin-[acetyl-CoA-carboxylase] ligase